MKTTVEIPEDLFRQAKAKAALDGIPLRDLVVYGLQLALEKPPAAAHGNRAPFPLIKASDRSYPLTDADVADALAKMGDEEVQHHAGFVRR